MGKLGKKARKFAKKGLQSVHRQKRKQNIVFNKRRKSPKGELDAVEGQNQDSASQPNLRNPLNEDIGDESLDIFPFEDEDSKLVEENSYSDGYLTEDSSCLHADVTDNENQLEENGEGSSLSVQNQKIISEIEEQKKKLEKLKKKDPGFLSFLEIQRKVVQAYQDDEMDSNEDEASDDEMQSENGNISSLDNVVKSLTNSIVDNWSHLVMEQHSMSALPSLLNAYRTACHFGTESSQAHGSAPSWRLQNSETFCSTIMFMLREGDNVFRDLLGISPTNRKIETVQELQNSSKWKQVKPMIKSYLRSTLFLLSQNTDADILVFALSRLRASLIFFSAFKPFLHKLILVAVHLWATEGESLSSCSFKILYDVASLFGSDIYNDCLKNMYKSYISCCKVTELVNSNHKQSLRDSFVQFFSIDLQKSVDLALVSTQRLAKIFELGIKLKREDALTKICSWEYVLCIDLWVQFISANIKENNLQGLSFSIIQVINGMVLLHPGSHYMPLKIRCIQWLNQLSSSSGMFIPVSSLVFDLLEYNTGKEGGKFGEAINFQKSLKLPKYCFKSKKFQEECVLAAVELLSAHFNQWSYHISFPELANVSIVRLKKFHEKLTVEGLRAVVKRLIEQVEKNIEFVQRKRDPVSFSPKDQESVKSFAQIEKSSAKDAFSQYYRSIIEKATMRTAILGDKISSGKQNKSKRRQPPNSTNKVESANGAIY
ncbi:hypothetical protein V2J09_008322 [Rumex salicifolius]